MRATLIRSASMIAILLCSLLCRAQTQGQYQIFFVSVGSGWYVTPIGNGIHGFSRIQGANKSAEIVADALVAGGAEYGVELTSDDQSFVTVADMYRAIHQVADKIVAIKPPRPLFVFYFAGHGMSEGIAWSHFSIPGDFAYRGDAANLDIEGLSNSTLYAGSLVDELQKLHIPFLVILDNCYDGKERSFESSVLSPTATRNLKDVGAVLRAMNEFRDTYPVLFSTTPGKSVVTVTNPLEPNSQVTIAPLARRFSLSVRPDLDHGGAVPLNRFLSDMLSPTLDTLTGPAVTHSPVPNGADALFLVPSAQHHPPDEQLGTGKQAQVCCRSIPIPAPGTGVNSGHFTGKLSISGNTGEYISSGSTLVFANPHYKVLVTQQGPGNLRIRFEQGETEFDASFSTPSGERFEVKEYAGAQRWNMADPGHSALEVSGDGRGCGDIVGSFSVSDVGYEPDGSISRFAATFSQLCDDSKLPAHGSVELARMK